MGASHHVGVSAADSMNSESASRVRAAMCTGVLDRYRNSAMLHASRMTALMICESVPSASVTAVAPRPMRAMSLSEG
jgi:hypothetical protein